MSVQLVIGLCFVLHAAGVLGGFAFAFLIDRALLKRHPGERDKMRLHALSAYWFYAWKDHGRQLDDPALGKLLDRYCGLQLAMYANFGVLFVISLFGN